LSVKVICGDCVDVMGAFAANTIDAIVTDPPYGLEFMGKDWDHGLPGVPFWSEALRVAKPGAMLLAFGGTRTYHRLACALEDAGWEIRDCIMWVYGSGFPKSHNIGKAIDKVNGEAGRLLKFTKWMRTTPLTRSKAADVLRVAGLISKNGTMAGHFFAASTSGQPAIPTPALWAKLRPLCGEVPKWVDELVDRIEAEREVVGQGESGKTAIWNERGEMGDFNITSPATPEAQAWDGWGTALKPAYEPIIVAMKPVDGTFANNALKWGVAGLNIDECRVAGEPWKWGTRQKFVAGDNPFVRTNNELLDKNISGGSKGRWPANIIHDGSDEVVMEFPQTKSPRPYRRSGERAGQGRTYGKGMGAYQEGASAYNYGDSGSAARFFYCAKASKAERNRGCEGLPEGEPPGSKRNKPAEGRRAALGEPRANYHPTVKPLALMRYLVKLVSRPEHTILDPFGGSGSTGVACEELGRNAIIIDNHAPYCLIAKARIKSVELALHLEGAVS